MEGGLSLRARAAAVVVLLAALTACRHSEAPQLATRYGATGLGANPLQGDIVPVHDPSLIHAGNTWYAFTTDLPFTHATSYLAIRCSPDLHTWQACGYVFAAIPDWVRQAVPSVKGLWAPEAVYFRGLYHLYYAASSFGSQHSVIGVATNTTLDPRAPGYRWLDQGQVLASRPGDPWNAIDPSVLVEPTGVGPIGGGSSGERNLWLTYGSFWTGIHQRRLDPATGKLDTTDTKDYRIAARPRDPAQAVEGASLIEHRGWYYLFVSYGRCCEIPIERDNYRQLVGRSRSVHGPFVGEDGSSLMQGGGTVLLDSNALWLAPGGGSAYVDPATGETMLAFHALRRSENGALYLWIKRVTWKDDWPVLADP